MLLSLRGPPVTGTPPLLRSLDMPSWLGHHNATVFRVMLPFLLLSATPGAPDAVQGRTLVIDGGVTDALAAPENGGILLVTKRGDRMVLLDVGAKNVVKAGPAVPKEAMLVDRCRRPAGPTVIFQDQAGLVGRGERLLTGQPLLAFGGPGALVVSPLCGHAPSTRDELRLVEREGVTTLRRGDRRSHNYAARARLYSGRAQRGLRPARPYQAAISLYVPRFYDVDLDNDGDLDLLVHHEAWLAAFARGADGQLGQTPAVVLDLFAKLHIAPGADLRLVADQSGASSRGDLVVGVTRGAIPESSIAWLLPVGGSHIFAKQPRKLWSGEGFQAPLGLLGRRQSGQLLVSRVNTSMLALGSGLLKGRVDVALSLRPLQAGRSANLKHVTTLSAALDVRGGQMEGALPILGVDLNGDGWSELVDVATPGKARVFLGTAEGFASEPALQVAITRFTRALALPRVPAVVLIGAPKRGQTAVSLLRSMKSSAR